MSRIAQEVIDSYSRRPRMAILMSGAGSNALSILQNTELRDLYDIHAVATDNPNSRATELAQDHALELVSMPQARFKGTAERLAYFEELATRLGGIGVQGAIYAGFMKIATQSFCERFPGVNVHPANLVIMGDDGLAKYRGMDALPDMRRDEGYVQASVHVIDTPVDTGAVLSMSPRLYPEGPDETDAELHNRLKAYENKIFPQTLQLLGSGALVGQELPLQFEDVA